MRETTGIFFHVRHENCETTKVKSEHTLIDNNESPRERDLNQNENSPKLLVRNYIGIVSRNTR